MNMRKIFLSLFLALCLLPCTFAAGKVKGYVVGFYNVENLFDTTHDEGKNDYEFTPDGKNVWTKDKYKVKLDNIARVVKAMAEENGKYHSVLGLAEVENDAVLRDLVAHKDLASAKYKYVHFESPDPRGIDCALLYRPDQFKPLESKAIPYDFNSKRIKFERDRKQLSSVATRDILMVRGKLAGEMFAFFVAHMPSRLGDKGSDMRCRAAEIIYDCAMQLEKDYPGIKIVVMGDMNDNPEDESMVEYLRGKESLQQVKAGDFFDPFLKMHKDGFGSEEYKGDWNIFDIIMVNSALADRESKGLKIQKSDKTHYGYVFKRDFLTQQSGRYKGTPWRTFSNGEFIKGYSDHYPTYIVISK